MPALLRLERMRWGPEPAQAGVDGNVPWSTAFGMTGHRLRQRGLGIYLPPIVEFLWGTQQTFLLWRRTETAQKIISLVQDGQAAGYLIGSCYGKDRSNIVALGRRSTSRVESYLVMVSVSPVLEGKTPSGFRKTGEASQAGEEWNPGKSEPRDVGEQETRGV